MHAVPLYPPFSAPILVEPQLEIRNQLNSLINKVEKKKKYIRCAATLFEGRRSRDPGWASLSDGRRSFIVTERDFMSVDKPMKRSE